MEVKLIYKKSYVPIIVLAFVILITSGHPLSTVPGNLNYYSLIPLIFFIYFRLKRKNIRLPKSIFSYAFFLFIFLTFSSFIFNSNISILTTNIKFLLVIIFSYMFCLLVPFNLFSKYYIFFLKFISVTSLIGYSILNFTSYNLPLSTFKNVNDVEYYNGVFFFAIKSFGVYGNTGVNRNIGSFWEPGLFATFLLIAIVLELWQKKKSSKLTIIIFLVALLTTKSTFGYLMLLPISLLIFSKILNKNLSFTFSSFVIGCFLFLAFNFNDIALRLVNINPDLFSKLIEESNSLNERIESPLINLKIFSNNYIFGAGLGNTENLFKTMTIVSQTSTSTYFLAAFGFLGISYTLLFIYGALSFKKVNIISRFIFLIIILSQINKEPHIYFTSTFILMFYFLKLSNKRNYSFEE